MPHTRGRLRLIFDRRPQNDTEESLGWCCWPTGSQLVNAVVREWETMRGSGDDLECWFYCLARERIWGIARTMWGDGGIVHASLTWT